jgi:hypothetical protein
MTLLDLLSSETGLAVVGTVLGGIWTAFRSSEWHQRAQRQRYSKSLQALEAGVELTYRTYVQAIKEARAAGKLTAEEAGEARRRARDAAVEFGRTQGVDVLRELGGEYIDLWISKLVKRLKGSPTAA